MRYNHYPDECREIMLNNLHLTASKMAEHLNEVLGTSYTRRNVEYMRKKWNIKFQAGRPPIFTEEEQEYMFAVGKEYYVYEVREMINNKFNKNYSYGQIHVFLRRKGIKNENRTRKRRFPGRVNSGSFKKRCEHPHAKPIGAEVIREGLVWVKINDDEWRQKSRIKYEGYHNVKLTSDDFIIHLDGDVHNFDKDNLVKISRSESGALTRRGYRSSDKELTQVGLNLVRIENLIKEKENDAKTL